jgi:hypothetical protein
MATLPGNLPLINGTNRERPVGQTKATPTPRRQRRALYPVARLFAPVTFSGIVDVDNLCFGDPRQVKALTMAALLANSLPTTYVEEWLELASERVDALFWLYASCSLLWFIGEHQRSSNGNIQAPTSARFEQIVSAFDICLAKTETS